MQEAWLSYLAGLETFFLWKKSTENSFRKKALLVIFCLVRSWSNHTILKWHVPSNGNHPARTSRKEVYSCIFSESVNDPNWKKYVHNRKLYLYLNRNVPCSEVAAATTPYKNGTTWTIKKIKVLRTTKVDYLIHEKSFWFTSAVVGITFHYL